MDAAKEIFPYRPLAPSGANLLILLAGVIVFVWFCRIVRFLQKVYELNVAITSGQIVRLQHEGVEFGEIEMLWRTNLQQQLLRARRVTQAIPVRDLHAPFVVKKGSFKLVEMAGQSLIGIEFVYSSTAKVGVQLFWNVPAAALQARINRYNHEHVGRSGRGQQDHRRKKRLFGQRYMAVNDRETAAAAAASADPPPAARGGGGDRAGQERAGPGVAGAEWSPFFADSECASRSGVTLLDPATDAAFAAPDTSKVVQRAAPLAPPPATTGWARPAAAAVPVLFPPPPPPPPDAGGGTLQLVLTIRALAEPPRPLPAAAGGAAGKEAEAVRWQVLVLSEGPPAGAGAGEGSAAGARGRGALQLVKQVVVTGRAAYVTQEIYGRGTGDGAGDDAEECIICLSEPKDTTLLPCRHLCVCRTCFSRLEQCPVCRGTFTAYLRQPAKPAEDDSDGQGTEAPVVPAQAPPLGLA